MIARAAAGLAIAGLLLAGCAEKVSGHADLGGATPPGGSSTSPGGSSTSPGGTPTAAGGSTTAGTSPTAGSTAPPSSTAPSAHLACPRIVDLRAHLAYYCINGSMTPAPSTVWPFKVQRPVDVQWTMDEGSGDLTAFAAGKSPAAVAKAVVSHMISARLYGTPPPTTKTVQDVDATVGKARGHLVQTLITLNPGYVKAQHLRVRQERLWVLVVPVGPGRMSGWYTSIPDVARASWPKVPSIIKGLQIV